MGNRRRSREDHYSGNLYSSAVHEIVRYDDFFLLVGKEYLGNSTIPKVSMQAISPTKPVSSGASSFSSKTRTRHSRPALTGTPETF